MAQLEDAADKVKDTAKHMPMGFSCRSCGASVYNHWIRVAHYLRTGEACCATMRECAKKAEQLSREEASA